MKKMCCVSHFKPHVPGTGFLDLALSGTHTVPISLHSNHCSPHQHTHIRFFISQGYLLFFFFFCQMGLGSCNFFLIMLCLEAGSAKRKLCGFWHRWWAPLVSISVAPTVFSNLGTAACLLSAWA